MKNLEIMAKAGISEEHLETFEKAPKYTICTPYGEQIELQEYPKMDGFNYPGWMVLHDNQGKVYVKDWHDNEVCYYADIIENTFDCEYFGNIDVPQLWKEFKKNLNHQNILNVAWNKFPAGASYKDVKAWFEDEFNVLVKNDKVFLEE